MNAAETDVHWSPGTAALRGPPRHITGPTIVIWYQPGCAVCRFSESLFQALERNASGFTVVRCEVTKDVIRRYPHVDSLPMYDFVWPAHRAPPTKTGGTSTDAYGPDVTVETVRHNDLDRIQTLLLPRGIPW